MVAATLGTMGWCVARMRASWTRSMVLKPRENRARRVNCSIRHCVHANNVDVLEAMAHFEDAHRSPLARALYQRLLDSSLPAGPRREAALRRLVALDLATGDRNAANTHAAGLHSTGAARTAIAAAAQPVFPMGTIDIPGPMRGFARMAALAPDAPPDDLLLALARNVVTNGYQAVSGAESLDQTEYLKLVLRYLSQARELDKSRAKARRFKLRIANRKKLASCSRFSAFV